MFYRSVRGLYKSTDPNIPRYYKDNIQGYANTISHLGSRAEVFYDLYLQLPENLPSRVKELAYELTEGYSHDYDKAKAIERYLSKNYKYTLTPGDVPKGKDFVDYFLFESKEGYCTYYATAMTILLRCVEVPTRYVEGFIVTGSNLMGDGGLKFRCKCSCWLK